MQGVDKRVQFPGEKAPYDRGLAEAVASFAGALAAGDDGAFGGFLDLTTRGILDSMLADGSWFDATGRIEAVRVAYLGQNPDEDENADSAQFVLAVQEPGGAYTLGWAATKTGGGWVMAPLPTADLTLPRASDWDGEDFGAYAFAGGWGGGGPGGAIPTDDASAVMAFVAADTISRLMGEGGIGGLDPQKLARYAAMAGASGADTAAAAELVNRGKRLVGEGSRIGSTEARMLVQAMVTASGMLGQSWSEEQVLEAMAESLGISLEDTREIVDG
jgi:hypothetical protein